MRVRICKGCCWAFYICVVYLFVYPAITATLSGLIEFYNTVGQVLLFIFKECLDYFWLLESSCHITNTHRFTRPKLSQSITRNTKWLADILSCLTIHKSSLKVRNIFISLALWVSEHGICHHLFRFLKLLLN